MFIEYEHLNKKTIQPFIKNGIIIDTSVLKIFIDGLISVKINKKKSEELDKILSFFDIIKVGWDKFYITPHVLAETCNHFRNDYSKAYRHCYSQIVKEVFPIIETIKEKEVKKEQIMKLIDYDKPIIEIGDMSIFVIADELIDRKEKIAILAKDNGFNERYEFDKKVMIMDYNVINSLL